MSENAGIAAFVVAGLLGVGLWAFARLFNKTKFIETVPEGERGVIYRYGRFDQDVGPGRHWMVFGRTLRRVATNEQTMLVSNQEVLTEDRLAVRITALATYKIKEPRKSLEKSATGYYTPVYYAIQLALRDLAAAMPLEALVDGRTKFDERLLEMTKPGFADQGCELLSLSIRDMVLPGDVKRLATEITRAKMEGLAALERARGEQAALRTLANAARLIKGNPELMNLRVLQALSGHSGKTAPTVILGAPGGIVPIQSASDTAQKDDAPE